MAKEKTVKIRLPIIRGEETQERFVGVNGKPYKIKRGITVDVPESVAEVIRHSEEQEYLVEELMASLEDSNK